MERVKVIGEGKPVVGVISLIHGNEKCGLSAIESLEGIKLKKGTLVLIKANLEAAKENKRFIEKNLNRSFPGDKNGLLEDQIAYELNPYIMKCDYLLDLHSASEETEPFMFVSEHNENNEKVASYLGINKVVELGGQIKGTTLEGDGVRIVVECGQHNEENSREVAIRVTNNFLKGLGIIDGEVDESELSKFRIVETIKVNKEEFVPNPKLKSFELITEGVSLGSHQEEHIFADGEYYPLLIDKKIAEDYMYLAVRCDRNDGDLARGQDC